MKTQAIIPTAGSGSRFNSTLPKSLVTVRGKPLFVYALEVLKKSPLIDSVVLVVPQEHHETFEKIVEQSGFTQEVKIVNGGATRCDSVGCGLEATDADTDIVLIHDGARPLIGLDVVEASIKLCAQKEAVVVAVPVTSTIKKIDTQNMLVQETLAREELWEIQTPQVFKREILRRAYVEVKNKNDLTDDASLVERLGMGISVLKGDYRNIKVTTPEDLFVLESFLSGERI